MNKFKDIYEKLSEKQLNYESALYARGYVARAYIDGLITKEEFKKLNNLIPLTPVQLEKINF